MPPVAPNLSSPARADLPLAAKDLRRRRRRRFLGAVGALAAVAAAVTLLVEVGGWRELVDALDRADPVLTVLLMAALPPVGFSIGVVYVVAGLKFGLGWGGVVIAGVTAVHLVAMHGIARTWLQRPLAGLLARRGHRLPAVPPGAETSVAAMVALVPGPPYVLRNYGLALSGMELGRYFLPCVLIYTLRSYVTLALGHLGARPEGEGLAWLAAVFVAKLGICAVLVRRIRRRHRAAAARVPGAGAAP